MLDLQNLQGAWIKDRNLCLSRKWAPCSQLAIHVAKQAIAQAGLQGQQLQRAGVIAGSSRGNALLRSWPERRPIGLMAASNSMHGEIASAVTIELGIQGPWQALASGCAASLDALGTAWMMLQSGLIKHAIVLGVELPLVAEIIQDYQNTGVLSANGINNPYHPQTSGFFPGEAATAIVLEASQEHKPNCPQLVTYHCNSDAHSPIGMPPQGDGLSLCITQTLSKIQSTPVAICPHASGTLLHAQAEQSALTKALSPLHPISLHTLKPFTGHTVGACGALETAILAHYMRSLQLPPNLPNLSISAPSFFLPAQSLSIQPGQDVLNIAVGMGGHNSCLVLRAPENCY